MGVCLTQLQDLNDYCMSEIDCEIKNNEITSVTQ